MRIVIILLPWLELLTLIELGIQTSALAALGYVIFTAVMGAAIVQRQGRGLFQRLQHWGRDGRFPGPELLLDDMAMGFAGLLLMVPGLITDLLAVIVAISALRRRLTRAFSDRAPDKFTQDRSGEGPVTLEGDYRRVDSDNNR